MMIFSDSRDPIFNSRDRIGSLKHFKKNPAECYKKVLYAGPKYFDNLKLEPATNRKPRPDLQLCPEVNA